MSVLQLADFKFGDQEGLSDVQAAAALLVGEAARKLDALYNAFDAWDIKHDHVPKGSGRAS
ncbi:MAG: hypothetical protein ABI885_22750 [Gammaproteobacteria bacterium]